MVANVKRGDTVIDVGMNVGQVAALAASLVGESGRVLAFEPNTVLVDVVVTHLSQEGIRNTHVFPFALGSVPARLTLKFNPNHLGGATLRASARALQEVGCTVAVADQLLEAETMVGKVFLKMDVEGFEVEALSGMRSTLQRVDHAVIEITPEWLGQEGVKHLFHVLEVSGLRAQRLSAAGVPSGPLTPRQVTSQENVLFLRSV
jgi:FkbM family methyltransferase